MLTLDWALDLGRFFSKDFLKDLAKMLRRQEHLYQKLAQG